MMDQKKWNDPKRRKIIVRELMLEAVEKIRAMRKGKWPNLKHIASAIEKVAKDPKACSSDVRIAR